MTKQPVSIQVDEKGIGIITIDLPDSPVNISSQGVRAALVGIIDKVISNEQVRGVVIEAVKSIFSLSRLFSMGSGTASVTLRTGIGVNEK